MKILYLGIKNIKPIDEKINLCLGFFDGVHLGHQELINEAKKYPGKVGVLSFESSPKSFKDKRVITPFEVKKEIFESLGVDYLLLLKVNEELINTSKDDFIKNCLDILHPSTVICGDDFTFGKGGLGTYKDLIKRYDTKVVSLMERFGKKISSRDIKALIENGDIEKANELLGRNYMITNHAQKGFGKGRTLGFNTVNVPIGDEYISPKYGVYLTQNLVNGRWYYGLTNVGVHPTINKLNSPIIEAHLLDYDTYCEIKDPVKVKFIKFIRDEKCFASVKELQEQVLGDIQRIKEYLKSIN